MLLADPPNNMIAQSQSGTGKTAAFVLSMLSRVDATKNFTQVKHYIVHPLDCHLVVVGGLCLPVTPTATAVCLGEHCPLVGSPMPEVRGQT